MSEDRRPVLRGEVLPSQQKPTTPQLPRGLPFGSAYLGERKYRAWARCFEAYDTAIRAAAGALDGQAEYVQSGTRLARALGQSNNLDLILDLDRVQLQNAYNEELRREGAAQRAAEQRERTASHVAQEEDALAEINRMRIALEKVQLLERAQGPKTEASAPSAPVDPAYQHFGDAISKISGVPFLRGQAARAKLALIKQVGGEENLSQADRDAMELIDLLANEAIAKSGEG